MNTCICGCNQPIPQNSTGRPQKFINDAHRKAFKRAILSGKLTQPPPTTQPNPPTPNPPTGPTSEQLIENCWDHLPPQIAAYMPVQPHQSIDQLKALEALIHHRKIDDSDCKF